MHKLNFSLATISRELGWPVGILCATLPQLNPDSILILALAYNLIDTATALVLTKDFAIRDPKADGKFWLNLVVTIPAMIATYWIWSGLGCLFGHLISGMQHNLSASLALRMDARLLLPCVLLAIPGCLWRPLHKIDIGDKFVAPILHLASQIKHKLGANRA